MTPTCPRLPEPNGDGHSQASIDYDHRVELSVSLRSTSRKITTYMGVGIRSDELLVSIDYRLGRATYHGNIGFSHNHTADTSGDKLT
jgi:hypothetical protein